VHSFEDERELNGVLRQLQQRDEQLRRKDASLVRALSCSAVSVSGCFATSAVMFAVSTGQSMLL